MNTHSGWQERAETPTGLTLQRVHTHGNIKICETSSYFFICVILLPWFIAGLGVMTCRETLSVSFYYTLLRGSPQMGLTFVF